MAKLVTGPFSEKFWFSGEQNFNFFCTEISQNFRIIWTKATKMQMCVLHRTNLHNYTKIYIKILRQCHYHYQLNGMDSLSLPLPNVITVTLKGNGNDILRVTVMTHLREFLNCSCWHLIKILTKWCWKSWIHAQILLNMMRRSFLPDQKVTVMTINFPDIWIWNIYLFFSVTFCVSRLNLLMSLNANRRPTSCLLTCSHLVVVWWTKSWILRPG